MLIWQTGSTSDYCQIPLDLYLFSYKHLLFYQECLNFFYTSLLFNGFLFFYLLFNCLFNFRFSSPIAQNIVVPWLHNSISESVPQRMPVNVMLYDSSRSPWTHGSYSLKIMTEEQTPEVLYFYLKLPSVIVIFI